MKTLITSFFLVALSSFGQDVCGIHFLRGAYAGHVRCSVSASTGFDIVKFDPATNPQLLPQGGEEKRWTYDGTNIKDAKGIVIQINTDGADTERKKLIATIRAQLQTAESTGACNATCIKAMAAAVLYLAKDVQ